MDPGHKAQDDSGAAYVTISTVTIAAMNASRRRGGLLRLVVAAARILEVAEELRVG